VPCKDPELVTRRSACDASRAVKTTRQQLDRNGAACHKVLLRDYLALQASEKRYRKLFENARRAPGRVNARLDEEAKRIALCLHDEAGQLLASVYVALGEIADEVPARARARFERLYLLLDQVDEQLRHLSHELRPVILDDFGLLPALEFLAQGVSKRTGLSVEIDASLNDRLPALIENAVYRILQETLNNVTRHARACRVDVRLRTIERAISYSVKMTVSGSTSRDPPQMAIQD